GQHLGSKKGGEHNGSGIDLRAEGGYVIALGSAIIKRDGENIGIYAFEGVLHPAAELFELSPKAIEKLAALEPGIVKKRPRGVATGLPRLEGKPIPQHILDRRERDKASGKQRDKTITSGGPVDPEIIRSMLPCIKHLASGNEGQWYPIIQALFNL